MSTTARALVAGADDAVAGADLAVGTRLRALRRARGLTLAALAGRAGLSIGHLSQLERGLSSPSLRVLAALAAPLGVGFASLFEPAPPPPEGEERGGGARGGTVVVRRAERARLGLWRTGVGKQLLTPLDDPGRLLLYEVVVAPGGSSGSEAYRHAGEEAGVVVEGALVLEVDGTAWSLAEGDSFRFASDRPHRFTNPGARAARIIWVNAADGP